MALFMILTTQHRWLLSAHGADDLSVGRETAGRFFGISNTIINTDLEHTAARAQQRHLRVWSLLDDYARRLTGARFIASLTAVLDFDVHRLPFLVCGDAEQCRLELP
jgi:hypothetical protein